MKQIFDSMALDLAKAAAEASKLSFLMRPTLARWRKHREAAKRVAVLVDAETMEKAKEVLPDLIEK